MTPFVPEVDAYFLLKESKTLGGDTRNLEDVASGQAYTQNECLSNSVIKKRLYLDKPENIVKVTETVLGVIEAKRSHKQIEQVVKEAKSYAGKLKASNHFKALIVSGVAGNKLDSFIIWTYPLSQGRL